MPRNSITKNELKCKILELKHELIHAYPDKTRDWQQGANHELNKILDILDEYRY
ncbi:hypothetical protein Syn7803C97_179 [Synechococcus phage S-MbCM6]|jgi:hypothetical protein|uniref:Uncharacterized protein n=3 Tax=Namakavirus smbcm6 TaxID=2734120 RepID=H8ZMU4_9CAUD|nr:hypothetical protein [Synechococcus phage ACG-2014c]AHB80814.1 hypothetical protein S-MbCM25_179 [Synechococcus phage S-MbCM25]AFD02805.1 hypothetical protein [Synechococcus phage ACG-2014c]AIX14575.1 hypothetical protein Syn7803C43_180 [Synechococcus phage ACG-2014c]AIX22732.1 hypothetical protein Syn7803C97_179 [Synechococcus phage ACG-2014c]AIX22947.1 hypothetical protein Syn7803C98_179 [Synechococcus phage ACG-2014c]